MTPDPYAPHLRQADELFAHGETVKAGQIWQAILKQHPAHAEARAGLLAVKQRLAALREAEAAAPASESVHPPVPEPALSPEPPPDLVVSPEPEPGPAALVTEDPRATPPGAPATLDATTTAPEPAHVAPADATAGHPSVGIAPTGLLLDDHQVLFGPGLRNVVIRRDGDISRRRR